MNSPAPADIPSRPKPVPAGGGAPTVVLAGFLPPPRNGMAIVTAHVRDALERAGLLLGVQDLTVPREAKGLEARWIKLRKVLVTIALLAARRGTPGRQFYTHCDANSGKLYTLLLCAAARAFGYRTLLHHHSYFYINQYSPLIALIIKVMGVEGRHLLLCDCMAQDFAARYRDALAGPVPTAIAHNRVWFPRRQPDRLPRGPAITIGHLGNLTWEKGSGTFLDLFESLRERGVDARAILLGDTLDTALNAKIAEVAGRHPKTFRHIETGAPAPEVKDGFFNAIDFFVMPTQYKVEAQPLVLIEARAMGVPVIATDRGCIRGDHEGGSNLIVPSGDNFVQVAGDWLVERRFEAGDGAAAPGDVNADLEGFYRVFSATTTAMHNTLATRGAE